MNQSNLHKPDWSKIPAPELDVSLEHLNNFIIPEIKLLSTSGDEIDLSKLNGLSIIYVYPMTGQPNIALPKGWDEIPGARGCTPQSCSFRDNFSELKKLNIENIFGLSSQTTKYQKEMSERLHLPYPILSDEKLLFANALKLPTFKVDNMNLIKRITLITNNNKIIKYFYPVFPPDQNVNDVIFWLKESKVNKI
ncbi:peroxiredoxin [Candidatus Fonsibacter ubiquis]|uniref:peroxiredoxin n=1 Tax=Candidatus Fonsibacter ubiquis TaxID=1925548 RepID=UPI000C08BBAE|nr:peroxiredoxin [Candidatus Fonsibacter ubiquis]